MTEEDPLISRETPQRRLSSHHQDGLLYTLHVFWPLGFICFGGAPAHIAILHDHLVIKHKWIEEELFLELFGLAQALPGNTSSQLAAAAAITRSGFLGGSLAILLFVLPGFVALLFAGIFLKTLVNPEQPPIILLGIPPTAIALICKACYLLGAKLDKLGVALAMFSTTVAIMINGDVHIPKSSSQFVYPALLATGGLVSLLHSLFFVRTTTTSDDNRKVRTSLRKEACRAIAAYFYSLLVSIFKVRRNRASETCYSLVGWMRHYLRLGWSISRKHNSSALGHDERVPSNFRVEFSHWIYFLWRSSCRDPPTRE